MHICPVEITAVLQLYTLFMEWVRSLKCTM